MAMKFDGVTDSPVDYARAIDYEYEHCDAEYEHDWCAEPEPSPSTGAGLAGDFKWITKPPGPVNGFRSAK